MTDEDPNSLQNTTVNDNDNCENVKICVLNGTTHCDIATNLCSTYDVSRRPTLDSLYSEFKAGLCDILVGENFDLVKTHLEEHIYTMDDEKSDARVEQYKVGGELPSMELISMVTRDGDSKFSDFCNWILQSLFSAEEMRDPSGVAVSALDLKTTLIFGERYETMFQDAYEVVGDYGQLYDEHLASFVNRSKANMINLGKQPGMYSISFGNTERRDRRHQWNSPTIKKIKEERKFVCGVAESPMLAEDHGGNNWTGIESDICKAIAGALGAVSDLRFEQPDSSDRFQALRDGEVDVLAVMTTRTMERDIKEESTGNGFSFSYPIFHDGILYGGEKQ